MSEETKKNYFIQLYWHREVQLTKVMGMSNGKDVVNSKSYLIID